MDSIDFDAALERRALRIDAMGEEEALLLVDRPQGLKALLAHEAGLTAQQAEDALASLLALSELRSLLLREICGSRSEVKPLDTIGHTEIAMLRPMAETLAMMDGNAFLGTEPTRFGTGPVREWWEFYVPEAKAVFDANGGLRGWASEASFAKAWAPLMAWATREPPVAATGAETIEDSVPVPVG